MATTELETCAVDTYKKQTFVYERNFVYSIFSVFFSQLKLDREK